MNAEKLIADMDRLKEFEADENGFLCFSAANSRLLSACTLRLIAHELDRRNMDRYKQAQEESSGANT